MIFLTLFLKRAMWWIWTGGTIGAYCGFFAGALHGFVLISVPFVFALAITLFSPASIFAINSSDNLAQWISWIFLGALGSALFGAIVGGIVGSFNFFVLSCSPHRFEWSQIVNSPARRIRVVALRGSFIGAFCVASSFLLLLITLKQANILYIVAAYAIGAIGGFAVGLFLGARSIVRENAARESSTR